MDKNRESLALSVTSSIHEDTGGEHTGIVHTPRKGGSGPASPSSSHHGAAAVKPLLNEEKPRRRATTKSGLTAPSQRFLDLDDFDEYEGRIKAYEDAEDAHFALEQHTAERSLLEQLRDAPKSLLQVQMAGPAAAPVAVSAELRSLAQMRLDVQNMHNDADKYDDEFDEAITLARASEARRHDAQSGSGTATAQHPALGDRKSSATGRMSADVHNVSQVWANRLGVISPAQGKLDLTDSSGAASQQPMAIKQKWPDWLVDESFEVTKVNSFGKRYARTLKLTQYHVLGASEQGVTKVYTYLDIKDVLVSLEPGEESITIKFKSDGKSFLYYTSMSPHIAQQITTRIQVRKQLEKSRSYSVSNAPGSPGGQNMSSYYNADNLRSVMATIDSANQKTKTGIALGFAEALLEKLIVTENATDVNGDRRSVLKGGRKAAPAPGSAGQEPLSAEAAAAASRDSLQARKSEREREIIETKRNLEIVSTLLVVEPNSKEHVVCQAIQKILFEDKSREFSTRTYFVNNLKSKMTAGGAGSSGADLAQEVRMWIEGMHEYILMRRGPSLASVLLMAEGQLAQNNAALFNKEDINRVLEKHVQQQEMLQHERAAAGEEGGEGEDGRGSFNPLRFISRDALLAISYLTFSVVEESVFLPLRKHLCEQFQKNDNLLGRDTALRRKMKSLQGKSQADWSIPAETRSPLEWSQAIFELQGCELLPTPSQMLLSIVSTAKSIFAEYEANNVGRSNTAALGADDLVPIFIFVLVQANLRTPLLTKDLLWSICQPSQLYGECGYYLTVYESALLYIENYGNESESVLEEEEEEEDEEEEAEAVAVAEAEVEVEVQQSGAPAHQHGDY